MKFELSSLNQESFNLKEGFIGGNVVYLVTPKDFGCNWTKETLHLRSVLLGYDGEVLSRGLNKFFNCGEKPELYPDPNKFKDWVVSNKEDGSLMICDYIFGEFNVRTRGVISYKNHENTGDFDFVIEKYKLVELLKNYSGYSILFELYSPNNVIVLKPYDVPEIVLLGLVDKETGTYHPFYTDLGKEVQTLLGCKVPETFTFDDDLKTIGEKIALWEGKEGVVLSYNKSQNLIKLKSEWYLVRHRMKSELNNLEKVLDFWVSVGYPPYQEFYKIVSETFDYEIAENSRGFISTICDAFKGVKEIEAGMVRFVEPLKSLPRRDAAAKILSSYGNTNRAAFVFTLLDGKPFGGKEYTKLMWQVLKK